MKSLFFNGKSGYPPEPGTLEFIFLQGCTDENADVWMYLSKCPRWEIESVISHLRDMGWGFEWVTLQ